MNNSPLVDETLEFVLSPQKSGAYLSKPDIGLLAKTIGFSIIFQERKKMFEEIFKFLRTKDELLGTYSALIAFYTMKKEDYESLFSFFPHANLALDENYEKCKAAIKKLNEFKEEAELLEFVKPENL